MQRLTSSPRRPGPHLRSSGARRDWPEPVLADSGNGFHLLYRVDIPAKDEGLVKRVLEALAARFSMDAVCVDQTVANAARIVKLYGTAARKGDDVPERRHRMSRLLEVPDDWQPVPVEKLRELAAEAPAPTATRPAAVPVAGSFDLEAFVGRHFPDARPQPWQGGARLLLPACPFNPDHTGGSAALLRHPSGAVSFKCQHASCAGRRWEDVRALLEPKAPLSITTAATQPPAITYEWLAPPPPLEQVKLDPAALYGLAGRWADAVAPHTEGTPSASS